MIVRHSNRRDHDDPGVCARRPGDYSVRRSLLTPSVLSVR
jgi:hypothetical protein